MEKKIKILHILPSLTKGGAEKVCFDILINLDRDKYNPSLLLFKDNDQEVGKDWKNELRERNIRVVSLKKRCLFDIYNFLQILKEIKKNKPDIIHTHLGGDIYGRLGAGMLGHKNIISTEHNINLSESKSATFLKKISARYAKHVFAVSKAVKSDAISRYNLKEEIISVIYNGVDTNYFHKNRTDNDVIIKEKGKEKIIIGALGRLTKQKGFSVLIEAANLLKRNDFVIQIAGEGEIRKELETLINKLKLEDKIKLVGLVEARKFLDNIDVFVFPSLWEGLGIVALEASAMEKPVIASDCGGIKEVIDENTGYLFEPGNSNQLAGLINKVLDNINSKELQEKTKRGREVVLAKFSLSKMIADYSFWYDKLYYNK